MPPKILSSSALCALLLGAPGALAQQVTNPAADSPESDVISLSEFTVTTSANSEYMATESTTGTRVASKIQDLPFAVNVVTGEFMDDFNALEFGDQFAYTSNVVAYETISTGYSVRGFEADVQLRNGFRRIGLIDKVSVDRAEVIKGPAASIYGTTLPGGIVNIITKKPKAKPAYRLGLAAGTNNYLRADASATGPVGDSGKFFYRVDLAADEREYDMPYKTKEQATGSVQLQWKPSRNTSLLVEFERLVRNEEGNANTPLAIQTGVADPYRNPTNSGPRTYTRYVRLADELVGFNTQGPNNYSKRFVNTGTVTFEHRFSDLLSFRSSANIYDRNLLRQEVAGRDQYNPTTGRISSATSATGTSSSSWIPRYRPYGEKGAGWQNDLLFSFDTGPVKHKLLVTADYQRQSERPQLFTAPNGISLDIRNQGLDVANPNYDYVTYDQDPSLYTSIGQDDHNSLDVYGLFVSERATMMDGRLILLAGGRYDYVDNHARSFNVTPQVDSVTRVDQFTHQLGLNFKVLKNVTAYLNQSTSFVPQYGTGRNEDGTLFDVPNEEGEGWEAGIKATLLDERLTFTAGYFDITRSNILRSATATDGTLYDVLSGEEGSTGAELDFNWVATRELQFFGSYGYTDSEVLSNDNARHLVGSSTRRTPAHTVGIGAKYDIKDGALKGLYFTAGYKYNSESLVNPSTGRNLAASASNPVLNLRLPNGLLINPDLPEGTAMTTGSYRVDDGRESIYNDAFSVVDVGMGYRWRTASRYQHKLQLNVTNLFDEDYTFGSGGQGQGTGGSLTYVLTF